MPDAILHKGPKTAVSRSMLTGVQMCTHSAASSETHVIEELIVQAAQLLQNAPPGVVDRRRFPS
eukprot:7702166-Pyramimonas_sp.AAC.1